MTAFSRDDSDSFRVASPSGRASAVDPVDLDIADGERAAVGRRGSRRKSPPRSNLCHAAYFWPRLYIHSAYIVHPPPRPPRAPIHTFSLAHESASCASDEDGARARGRSSSGASSCESLATRGGEIRDVDPPDRDEDFPGEDTTTTTTIRATFRVAQHRDRNCVSLTYIRGAARGGRRRIGVTMSFDNGAHT